MTIPEADLRSPSRRVRDEQIAAEPPLAPPELPPDAASSPLEAHLLRSDTSPVGRRGCRRERFGASPGSGGEIAGTLAGHYCRLWSHVTATDGCTLYGSPPRRTGGDRQVSRIRETRSDGSGELGIRVCERLGRSAMGKMFGQASF